MIIEIKAPSAGESITEVTIGQWLKQDGDFVEKDEIIAEIETDKASLEIAAEESGTLKILVPEGETVKVGTTIAKIDTDTKPQTKSQTPAKQQTQTQTPQTEEKIAMPAAEKMIREHQIDKNQITPTGKDDRILKEDVINFLNKQTPQQQPQQPQQSRQKAPEKQPEIQIPTTPKGSRNTRKEKLSHLRKVISKRLLHAKNSTAMLTTFNEVDLSAVIETRKKYKEEFIKKYGIKLGFMSFFVKACSMALLEFPQVNSQLSEDGQHINYFDYVDMGIAVSTDRGLMVPVIRNAESMNLAQIEMAIAQLAKKAREGKITIDDMTGGTFTITNGGVFGSLVSTPILNPPQTAILGMHRIQERPVAINGQVEIRPMMYLALSYDHRVIDGKEAVSFLYRVVKLLEDPIRMLIEV